MRIDDDLAAAPAAPLVLRILSDGGLHGYAIAAALRDRTGGHAQWSDGMLYPVLHRLERLGYVSSSWGMSEAGHRRKRYAVTRDGG